MRSPLRHGVSCVGAHRERNLRVGTRRVPVPGWRAAAHSLAAAVVVVGIWAGLYLHAARAQDREQVDRIQKDLDYVAGAAHGHVLYTPERWVEEPTTYPGFSTLVPVGGVVSSGALDGRWLIVKQFDADALSPADKGVSDTPGTLCELTGPAGIARTFRAASGKRVKVHTVCLDVPGHDARVRVDAYPHDRDALVDLAATLPEDGRILNAGFYEKVPAAVDDLVADPTAWAEELLDSLTVIDASRYSAEEIYSAEKDAGLVD